MCSGSEDDLARMMEAVLHGLVCLHKEGLVHADVREQNVLCNRAGPFLCDLEAANWAGFQVLARSPWLVCAGGLCC